VPAREGSRRTEASLHSQRQGEGERDHRQAELTEAPNPISPISYPHRITASIIDVSSLQPPQPARIGRDSLAGLICPVTKNSRRHRQRPTFERRFDWPKWGQLRNLCDLASRIGSSAVRCGKWKLASSQRPTRRFRLLARLAAAGVNLGYYVLWLVQSPAFVLRVLSMSSLKR